MFTPIQKALIRVIVLNDTKSVKKLVRRFKYSLQFLCDLKHEAALLCAMEVLNFLEKETTTLAKKNEQHFNEAVSNTDLYTIDRLVRDGQINNALFYSGLVLAMQNNWHITVAHLRTHASQFNLIQTAQSACQIKEWADVYQQYVSVKPSGYLLADLAMLLLASGDSGGFKRCASQSHGLGGWTSKQALIIGSMAIKLDTQLAHHWLITSLADGEKIAALYLGEINFHNDPRYAYLRLARTFSNEVLPSTRGYIYYQLAKYWEWKNDSTRQAHRYFKLAEKNACGEADQSLKEYYPLSDRMSWDHILGEIEYFSQVFTQVDINEILWLKTLEMLQKNLPVLDRVSGFRNGLKELCMWNGKPNIKAYRQVLTLFNKEYSEGKQMSSKFHSSIAHLMETAYENGILEFAEVLNGLQNTLLKFSQRNLGAKLQQQTALALAALEKLIKRHPLFERLLQFSQFFPWHQCLKQGNNDELKEECNRFWNFYRPEELNKYYFRVMRYNRYQVVSYFQTLRCLPRAHAELLYDALIARPQLTEIDPGIMVGGTFLGSVKDPDYPRWKENYHHKHYLDTCSCENRTVYMEDAAFYGERLFVSSKMVCTNRKFVDAQVMYEKAKQRLDGKWFNKKPFAYYVNERKLAKSKDFTKVFNFFMERHLQPYAPDLASEPASS